MKLLKPGKPAEVYRKTCPHCGAEFEYSDRDIILAGCSINYLLSVKCPWCGEEIKHEDEQEVK